ncbi:sugar ABC transporter permease [Dictyobacter sp. S3.2.2.5]|uniref:Sugar ABC transporter permease n=1 Tax=Dictyobacter halimunensis TaxID=3026934 RepID=A0ABQ6G196_9CHLR|nr:sugar ABC transporter permease [Dictyobacter sp. S3.2.2.5]
MAKADTTPQEQTVAEQPDRRSPLSTITDFLLRRREASIFIIAVILLICFQVANDNFLTLGNVKTLAEYTAETVIIAVGEVLILIMGEIDLSVGFTYALAPFIMYIAYNNGLPLFVGIILALLGSALIGLINGAVVVFFRVPSFIATLGAYFYLNGLTLTISNAFPTTTPDVGTFWNGVLGNNIYWESLWAVLFIVILQIVLSRTRWGLHTIAVGSNLVGSGEVGINVNLIKLRNFTLASLLAGFAGILLAFRVTSIDPSAGGANIMFEAVSGAVIGGTALQGGSGTIIGAFLGTLVLQILKDGLTLVGVSAFTFDIILGVVIVIAMILNIRLQVLRRGGNQ